MSCIDYKNTLKSPHKLTKLAFSSLWIWIPSSSQIKHSPTPTQIKECKQTAGNVKRCHKFHFLSFKNCTNFCLVTFKTKKMQTLSKHVGMERPSKCQTLCGYKNCEWNHWQELRQNKNRDKRHWLISCDVFIIGSLWNKKNNTPVIIETGGSGWMVKSSDWLSETSLSRFMII
jgi:hypothetical protein